ncbi:MAG: helix-turn-helix transcriptional regulator [Deltaproteobacteria bacterium]|nr:helix-turn-helix transcriptional regulator [Deltaproteobacteria bacterium]
MKKRPPRSANARGVSPTEQPPDQAELAEALDMVDEIRSAPHEVASSSEEAKALEKEAVENAERELAKAKPNAKFRDQLLSSIRMAMANANINQTELAKRSGLSKSVVNRLLKGSRGFNLVQLELLAKGLGYSATDMVSGRMAEQIHLQHNALQQIQQIKAQTEELDEKMTKTLRLAALHLPETEKAPPSLIDFVRAHRERISPREVKILSAVGEQLHQVGENPPEQYWLDLIRSTRNADPWPPR